MSKLRNGLICAALLFVSSNAMAARELAFGFFGEYTGGDLLRIHSDYNEKYGQTGLAVDHQSNTADYLNLPNGFVAILAFGAKGDLTNGAPALFHIFFAPDGVNYWKYQSFDTGTVTANFIKGAGAELSFNFGSATTDVAGRYTFTSSRNLLGHLANGGVGIGSLGLRDGNGFTLIGSIPEPATWTMMLLGVGLIGAAMRQRKLQHT